MRSKKSVKHTVTTSLRSKASRFCDMEVGQIGRDAQGKHFFRTNTGVVCLEDPQHLAYSFGCGNWACILEEDTNESTGPETYTVEILPPGTVVTLTVGKAE